MIFLFTDFGSSDVYVGQVKAELARFAPGIAVIDLLHDVAAFRIEAGAHLLAALAQRLPPDRVTIAVVDPGVGTARKPVVVSCAERRFVGPDNGLLSVLAGRCDAAEIHEIRWRPPALSRSFHGRDLFAPIAAQIALGTLPGDALASLPDLEVTLPSADLAQIVYVDHYGNCMTGLRAGSVSVSAAIAVNGTSVAHAEVFGAVGPGEPFWYVNSIGLIEIACNRASAAARLGLAAGDLVRPAGR